MSDSRSAANQSHVHISPFNATTCLATLCLLCAITAEELLGYCFFDINGTEVSSYAILCLVQATLCIPLLAAAPKLIGRLWERPLRIGAICAAAFSVPFLLFGTFTWAPFLAGITLLSFATLYLKIANLSLLADIGSWKIPYIVFAAVLLHSPISLVAALPEGASIAASALAAILGILLFALCRRRVTAQASPLAGFRRPFTPSASIIVGVGIVFTATSFLNPLYSYPTLSLGSFLLFTFCTHFLAALLLGALIFAGHDSSFTLSFQCVNTLVLVGFFLMAFIGISSLVPRAVCTLAFSLFEFVTFLALATLASYTSSNQLRLFSGYYLLVRIGALLGIVLGLIDTTVLPFGIGASLIGAVLAILCVITAVWLITGSHLDAFFWGNTTEAIARSSENTYSPKVNGAELPTGGTSNSFAPPEQLTSKVIETANDLVSRSISVLTEQAGLTPRESEVFALLAQGRSATFIAEQLYVSNNTIRKHIAHVYEKLGVHSKQELLTLVQQKSTSLASQR